jgi:hypothetical protein
MGFFSKFYTTRGKYRNYTNKKKSRNAVKNKAEKRRLKASRLLKVNPRTAERCKKMLKPKSKTGIVLKKKKKPNDDEANNKEQKNTKTPSKDKDTASLPKQQLEFTPPGGMNRDVIDSDNEIRFLSPRKSRKTKSEKMKKKSSGDAGMDYPLGHWKNPYQSPGSSKIKEE